jgi:KaiC/GvpD/RAD55 family RecA-like ATPase
MGEKPRATAERVRTGVKGFDSLIEGGLIPGSIMLVTGKAGAGKTIFSAQYLYNGALAGEPGLYITTEEKTEKIYNDVANFGWDIEKLQEEKKFIIIEVGPMRLAEMETIIKDAKKKYGITRCVVDSLSVFALFFDKKAAARKRLNSVLDVLTELKITTIATAEIPEDSERLSRLGLAEFMADGVIVLQYLPMGREFKRALQIRKMRMSNHSKNIHPFRITKKGIEVFAPKVPKSMKLEL